MMSLRKFLTLLSFSFFLLACSDSKSDDPVKQLANPAPTTKPEVIEFFAYFCGHCFNLDPKVESWRKRLPKSVNFKRVPLTLGNPAGRIFSRVYYISESLGVLEKSHLAMFQLIHVQKKSLVSDLQMKNFFISLGISEKDFEKALNDPEISNKVEQAEALAKEFRIIRVPGFVVNGKYFTDVAANGSEKKMFTEINRLLRKK